MSLEDLGRRAVACKHWRWMPGMRALVGPTNAAYRYITPEYAPPEGDSVGFFDPMPDLSDPATLGCLLHLVREAWPDEWHKHVVPMWNGRDGWAVGCVNRDRRVVLLVTSDGMLAGLGNSEASALVAALEAAP